MYDNRETIDSYTIAASPSFGLRRLGSSIISEVDSREFLGSDVKTHLLAEKEKVQEQNVVDGISVAKASWSEKASSLHEQLVGELPISCGCSLTQTIFNGKKNLNVVQSLFFFYISNSVSLTI